MIFKGIKKHKFYLQFQTDEDCMAYLAALKWSKGYECRKCGHTGFMKGKRAYSRRCRSCKYDESVTSHGLFHKLKFSLRTAFDILFQLSSSKKSVSSLALHEELELRYETCLNFRRKAQKAMESSRQYPLQGNVEVDEFVVGGYDADSPGRAKGDKKLIAVALEVRPEGKLGRAYARQIQDFSADELQKIFDEHIAKEAMIRTDQWKGYLPLQKVYPLLYQEPSEKGSNFQELHLHIMNIKNWIRGIHHHVSAQYIQRYMDEFHFRFNRRNFIQHRFHRIIEKMMMSPIIFHHHLKTRAT